MSIAIILLVLVIFLFVLTALYFRPGRCHSRARLDGRVTLITGANTGIGKETALDFATRGAVVVMASRNLQKGLEAAEEIRKQTGNENIHIRKLDLGSLTSVREFAAEFLEEFSSLHILVNNAGVMACPYGTTEDGFETHMGINHLGHFALTNLLLPAMKDSGQSRIVNVSSSAHHGFAYFDIDDMHWQKTKYSPYFAYGQSKLANILFTKELHRKLSGTTDISVFALHPGVVNTELYRHQSKVDSILALFYRLLSPFIKTPNDGAQTNIYCSVEEGLEKLSGEYFVDCRHTTSYKMSYDVGLAKKLWEKSEELTKIIFPLYGASLKKIEHLL